MKQFTVNLEDREGSLLVVARGELDLATAPELEAALAERNGNEPVTIDLRGLTFLDSSGLRAILTLDRRLAETGGKLTLVRGAKAVHQVFEIAGLDKKLDFVDEPELPSGAGRG